MENIIYLTPCAASLAPDITVNYRLLFSFNDKLSLPLYIKLMSLNLIISFLATLIFVGNAALAFADEIRIGAFNDLSGATSDVGWDYALGIAEAIRYVNNKGFSLCKRKKFIG